MASEVLYFCTGIVCVLMAAHHFLTMCHGAHERSWSLGAPRHNALHAIEEPMIAYWAEMALCAIILLFGIWLAISAGISIYAIAMRFMA